VNGQRKSPNHTMVTGAVDSPHFASSSAIDRTAPPSLPRNVRSGVYVDLQARADKKRIGPRKRAIRSTLAPYRGRARQFPMVHSFPPPCGACHDVRLGALREVLCLAQLDSPNGSPLPAAASRKAQVEGPRSPGSGASLRPPSSRRSDLTAQETGRRPRRLPCERRPELRLLEGDDLRGLPER
jgi:hypothetical protein